MTHYNWDIIKPFFKSFKKAKFENCECVIFVDNMSLYIINKIKSFGIFVYEVPDKLKNKTIINTRWKLYYDFLNDNAEKYKLVLAVDIRYSFFSKKYLTFMIVINLF